MDSSKSDEDAFAIVPCRYHCGFLFCSPECEEDAWYGFHQCLCTGQCEDDQHPLVQFKRYATETNEILLLVAEWWVAQHGFLCGRRRHQRDTTRAATPGSSPKDDLQAPTARFPDYDDDDNNKYEDFVMNPWWDVVVDDDPATSDMDAATSSPTNSSPSSLLLSSSSSSSSSTSPLKQSLMTICHTAAELLRQAWSKHHHDDSKKSLMVGSSSSFPSPLPEITALDIAKRIGACEQNAIGIRQRHALCRSILEADESLLERRKEEIVHCLTEAGFIGNDNDEDDDCCDDDCCDNNDDDDDDDENDSLEEGKHFEKKRANHSSVPNVKEATTDNRVAGTASNNTETPFPSTSISGPNVKEKGQDGDDADDDVKRIYSADEIATFIANDLFVDEEGTVRDEANSTMNAGADFAGKNGSQQRDSVGDDLDYVFVPLDGTAMYATACKMNHSCDPNVLILYKPAKGWGFKHPLTAYCVALRDIVAHEELTISYIDVAALPSYRQRQQALAHYGFVCHCRKCLEDKKNEEDQQQEHSTVKGKTRQPVLPLEESDGINGKPFQNDPDQEDSWDDPFGDDDDGGEGQVDAGNLSGGDTRAVQEDQQKNDTGTGGVALLQKRVERLDTVSNHSTFGAVPKIFHSRITAFVVQNVGELNHQQQLSSKNDDNMPSLLVQRELFTKCAKQGMVNRDFAMCRIVGCDLEQLLFTELTQNGAWSTSWQRQAYWCACLTAATGLAHECRHLEAMQFLDKAMILGLPRSNKQLGGFILYVEHHANETASGPYHNSRWRFVNANGSSSDDPSLQQLMEASIPVLRGSTCDEVNCQDQNPAFDHFVNHYVRASKPLVLRHFASTWPASHKWRSMRFLSQTHGHRLVPVELGSMMETARGGMMEQAMTLRHLVDRYLLPSTARSSWTLADATCVDRATDIAYLAQHHLLDQIPEIGQELEMAPALCGPQGPLHVNVWIGTGGTRTPLHYDSDDNILVQLVGAKYIRLYAPRETPNLYVEDKEMSRGYGLQRNMSQLDCEQEDWRSHPLAENVEFQEVVQLGPGDALFIPSRWWHYVRSLSTSASVNYWF
ncbi:hypothetical protein ACA910_019913 [Epithemia clementina (nom. ined.)]